MKNAALPRSPLDHPRVVALTRRFHRVRKEMLRGVVRCIIKLGRILYLGRHTVSGQYGRWVKERLRVSYTTAEKYAKVYEFHRDHPDLVKDCIAFGAKAMLRLARLTPEGRAVVREKVRLLKTRGDLVRLTAPYLREVKPHRPGTHFSNVRRRVKAVTSVLQAVQDLPSADSKDAVLLQNDLVAMIREAEAALRKLGGRVGRKRTA